jgi:tripartite-type tricarboxylate transporter receptor subunit TctC
MSDQRPDHGHDHRPDDPGRRRFHQGAAALALGALAGPLRAQTAAAAVPATTVLWSGFPPGGLGDQVTRPLLDKLRGRYPSAMVLESKPGAGGRIAADFVKRATPDGATLLQTPSSVVALYPHLYPKLPYQPLTDFIPVVPMCSYAVCFTAGPGLPADIRSLADYLRWAKASPANTNYGIPAAGSALHFAGMLLARSAGVALNSVPYRGGGPLLQDLLGGQIPVSFNVVSEVLPHVRSGKLRALAITSPQRWPALPEVPTMAELGVRDCDIVEFLGWYAPAGTPTALVQRLNTVATEALATPEMSEVLTRLGLQPMRMGADEFARIVRREHDAWGPLVKATGFKAEE